MSTPSGNTFWEKLSAVVLDTPHFRKAVVDLRKLPEPIEEKEGAGARDRAAQNVFDCLEGEGDPITDRRVGHDLITGIRLIHFSAGDRGAKGLDTVIFKKTAKLKLLAKRPHDDWEAQREFALLEDEGWAKNSANNPEGAAIAAEIPLEERVHAQHKAGEIEMSLAQFAPRSSIFQTNGFLNYNHPDVTYWPH